MFIIFKSHSIAASQLLGVFFRSLFTKIFFLCVGCLCSSITPCRINIKVKEKAGCITTGLVLFYLVEFVCHGKLSGGLSCLCSEFNCLNSPVVAHAGDGNFHVLILFDPTKEEQRREAEKLNKFMVSTALSMEGKFSLVLHKFILGKGLSRLILLIGFRHWYQV